MRIAEIFRSWQGEGFLTGTPSVFVRTSGCNLRCWFCDTPYTSWDPEGEDLSLGDILGRVEDLLGEAGAESPDYTVQSPCTPSPRPGRGLTEPAEPCRHIVLTGGEPMLFAELVPLTAELRQRGLHITIETAGTLDLPVECDLMSISPKLASSTPTVERAGRWHDRHEQSRHVPGVIRRLVRDYSYQIKFVVDSQRDCEAVEAWLQEFPEIQRSRVLLMPQGTELERLNRHALWLEPYCHQHGFHYCPRKHIEWFGCARGT